MNRWKMLTFAGLLAVAIAAGFLFRAETAEAYVIVPPVGDQAICYQAFLELGADPRDCADPHNYWSVYLGSNPPLTASQLCPQVGTIAAQAQAQGWTVCTKTCRAVLCSAQ